MAAAEVDPLFAAFFFAITTGARRGEIAGLEWTSVDLEAGFATIRRSIAVVDDKLVIEEPKTARGRRRVALDPSTVTVLRNHRKHQLAMKMVHRDVYEESGLVFARADGSPIHPDRDLLKRMQRIAKAAGVPRRRFHDLRHLSATLALAEGVNPKVVADRLGHGNVSLTLQVYSHAIPGLEAKAADRIAARLQ